jgi:shikimate dehydrogenase
MISCKNAPRKYVLIGKNIKNSISPFIYNWLADAMSVNMTYFLCENNIYDILSTREKFINWLIDNNISGANVTSPYKEAVIKFSNINDKNVLITGSANVIKYDGNNLFCFNTDVYGIQKCFVSNKVVVEHKDVLIIGAGGAARSAVFVCANCRAKKIYIANRTIAKAKVLSEHIKNFFPCTNFVYITLDRVYDLRDLYLIVQATSVGHNSYSCIVKDNLFSNSSIHNIKFAFDLIYLPTQTTFLSSALKNNFYVINGIEMLFYQAVKTFEIWYNVKINDSLSKALFEDLLKQQKTYEKKFKRA